jgi:hypothetical protein
MPNIQIDDYQFQFNKVISNDSTRACLMKYLQMEHNAEPLKFWEDCQELLNNYTSDTIMEQVNTIYDTYIKRGAKMELNISSSELKKVSDGVTNTGLVIQSGQDAYALFQPALWSVAESLEKDTFARFVRRSIILNL